MPNRSAPKNCYWRGKVLWGRIEVAGKEYKWSLRTSDAAVARRRVKTERERLIGETHFGEQRHSYPEVAAEWATAIAGDISPATAKRYAASLKALEAELLPLFIDEIDKAVVQKVVRRRRAEGVTTATIRRDLTALSGILDFAEDHDYREGNPALSVTKKLTERRNPIALPNLDHVRRVIDRASSTLGAIAWAARLTGCRQNELQYAERANLDRIARQLRIRGKGNKARTIALSVEAFAHLDAQPAALGCRYLFWHSDGEPYRNVASAFLKVVKAEMKSAQKTAQENGLADPDFRAFRFHDLRHLFAVEWLKKGGSIYDLKEHLGHTSVKTTEMYLGFLTPEEKRVVMFGSAHSPSQEQRFPARDVA